jgi:hypothetical protein
MVTFLMILALICDWGYSNFPLSTLNWWTTIFITMAIFAFTAQLMENITLIRYTKFGSTRISIMSALVLDVMLTCVITILYSFIF